MRSEDGCRDDETAMELESVVLLPVDIGTNHG